MEKFCPNCGTKVDPQVDFCPNCGYSFKNARAKQNTEENLHQQIAPKVPNSSQTPSNGKRSSKNNKVFIALGVVIVLLIALGAYERHYYNSTNQVNRIIDTIRKGDNNKLATLVTTEDSNVKINSNSVKSITNYYKNNPSGLTMLRNTLASGGNIKWISLVQDGKYFLLFPKYKLDVVSYSPTIETNHSNSKIYINNKYVKTAKLSGEDYTAKVGPMLGGKYDIKVQATASGHKLSTDASVNLWDENKVYNCNIKTADLAVLGPSGGKVYIANKYCGKLSKNGVLDLDDYQYNDETTAYIKYVSRGQTFVSKEANIENAVINKSEDDSDDSEDSDDLIAKAQAKTNDYDSKLTNIVPEFAGAPSLDDVNDLIKNCFKDTDSGAFVDGKNNKYYISFNKMSNAFDDSDKINDWEVEPDVYNVYPIEKGIYECDAKIDYEFDHENDIHIQVAHYPHITFKKDNGEFKILSVGDSKIIYDQTKKD